MERQYAAPMAHAVGQTISACRQKLRALREAGLVPGKGVPPQSKHVARIVLALAADTAKGGVERVNALRLAPLASPAELPGNAEGLLARLVEILPNGPVIGDLDLDDGILHIGETHLILEALTLAGKRACAVYGSRPEGVAVAVSIPLATIRTLAESIRDRK